MATRTGDKKTRHEKAKMKAIWLSIPCNLLCWKKDNVDIPLSLFAKKKNFYQFLSFSVADDSFIQKV